MFKPQSKLCFDQLNLSFIHRLELEAENYIKWIDLSIVVVVVLTLALTVHAYLVSTLCSSLFALGWTLPLEYLVHSLFF